MRENPERLAWTILLVSFFIFCLLVVSIPFGIRQYIATATESQTARVTAYGDAVFMRQSKQDAWTRITEPDQTIQEGTTLETGSSSLAVLSLFDDSKLQVKNNSQVRILESHTPRFDSSSREAKVAIEVQSGKTLVGVAPPQDRPRQFQVRTPHGLILLGEGSYSVSVNGTVTEIAVRADRAGGRAILQALGESIFLEVGERGRIEAERAPQGPLPGERNLLVNGDFQQPLSVGWSFWEERQKVEEEAGSGAVETVNGSQVMHFVRRGGNQQHAKSGIYQELDLDVRDAGSLEVRLNVRLIHQSLSGGGWVSSEFPLMVLLRYRDANGQEHDWVRGFYYANWDGLGVRDDEGYRGILMPQYSWYLFESHNLMLSLGDQRPVHLIELQVYASGHDYESMASDVGLFLKE